MRQAIRFSHQVLVNVLDAESTVVLFSLLELVDWGESVIGLLLGCKSLS